MLMFFLCTGVLFTVVGIVCVLVPGRVCDLFAASAHAFLSEHRADAIVRSQNPRAQRLTGVAAAIFGVFVGTSAVGSPGIPRDDLRDIVILVLAGVVAMIGAVVLVSRRPLAEFAARRIVSTGGERFCEPDVRSTASIIVRVLGGWPLIVAGLMVAFVLTAQWSGS